MENTIIHPTDFSDCANNALDYAILIAKALDFKITLVHSLDFSNVYVTDQNGQMMLEQSENIKLEAEEKLKKLGAKVRSRDVECDAKIFNGRVSSWLPDYVKEAKSKIVVMGTTGASNVVNKIMGSNTYSIIKDINIPLLAVPLNAKVSEFNKFVFSTDYRDADFPAIVSIAKIAQYYNASVDVIHIFNKEESKQVNREKLLTNLRLEVLRRTDYHKINFELLFGENVHERLQILTKEVKPDFLALVMRKQNFFERLFFGSLTEKLAYHSEVPVFIFPSEQDTD